MKLFQKKVKFNEKSGVFENTSLGLNWKNILIFINIFPKMRLIINI